MAPIITGRPLPTHPKNPTVGPGSPTRPPGAAAVCQQLGTVSSTWAWLPGLQSGQHALTGAGGRETFLLVPCPAKGAADGDRSRVVQRAHELAEAHMVGLSESADVAEVIFAWARG